MAPTKKFLLLLLACLTVVQGRVPHIILFSVDDELDADAWQAAWEDTVLASGARNPNGCAPPITWFTSKGPKRGDCEVVWQAYNVGHELASHTLTHPELPGLSYDDIAAEISQQRDWVVSCGIPADAVTGFRAPYFRTDDVVMQVLSDLGFQYDSSTSETSPTQRAEYTGSLWMVPAYRLPGGFRRSDPEPVDGMSVLQRLQADYDRKRGSGAPVSILVHEPYLSTSPSRDDIVEFLSWAFEQDNTWGLTYQQYIAWLDAGAGDVASMLPNSTCTS